MAAPVSAIEKDVEGISGLRNPLRRRLYAYVVEQSRPVGRDEAAAALSLSRSTVASHLDRLAHDGLLSVEFRRLGNRSGPGAGRPSKLYRRATRDISVSVPSRDYALMAGLLARAITIASASGRPIREMAAEVARREGESIGTAFTREVTPTATSRQPHAALLALLSTHGYEPRNAGNQILLANCPFRTLAEQFTELVCALNLELLRGLVHACGDLAMPRLEPERGWCCVRLYPLPAATGGSRARSPRRPIA